MHLPKAQQNFSINFVHIAITITDVENQYKRPFFTRQALGWGWKMGRKASASKSQPSASTEKAGLDNIYHIQYMIGVVYGTAANLSVFLR
jgi:hypothetical protein